MDKILVRKRKGVTRMSNDQYTFFKQNTRYCFNWDKINQSVITKELNHQKTDILFSDYKKFIIEYIKDLKRPSESSNSLKLHNDHFSFYSNDDVLNAIIFSLYYHYSVGIDFYESTLYFKSTYTYEYSYLSDFNIITKNGFSSIDLYCYDKNRICSYIIEDTFTNERDFERETLQKAKEEQQEYKRKYQQYMKENGDKVPFPTKESLDSWRKSGKPYTIYSHNQSEISPLPYPEEKPISTWIKINRIAFFVVCLYFLWRMFG